MLYYSNKNRWTAEVVFGIYHIYDIGNRSGIKSVHDIYMPASTDKDGVLTK